MNNLLRTTFRSVTNDERQQRENAVTTGLHQPRADISPRVYRQDWGRFGHRRFALAFRDQTLTLRNVIAHARNYMNNANTYLPQSWLRPFHYNIAQCINVW